MTTTEHDELMELRKGPRYAYRDIKFFCEMRDAQAELAHKLDLHATI